MLAVEDNENEGKEKKDQKRCFSNDRTSYTKKQHQFFSLNLMFINEKLFSKVDSLREVLYNNSS